jgi:hypothetical protein
MTFYFISTYPGINLRRNYTGHVLTILITSYILLPRGVRFCKKKAMDVYLNKLEGYDDVKEVMGEPKHEVYIA